MFISLGYMPRGRTAESHSNFMVSFLRNCPYVFVADTGDGQGYALAC